MSRGKSVHARRDFLRALGMLTAGAVAGCEFPRLSPAPPLKIHRVGRLAATLPNPTTDALTAVFREGLRDLGYVDGQNLIIEERYASGVAQLAEPAAELARLQAEVILVPSISDARVVLSAAPSMPIVSAGAGDLVAGGLAVSLAQPGGTVTGFSTPDLTGKQLQLFQQVLPAIKRIAVLTDPAMLSDSQRAQYETAAAGLGLHLDVVRAANAEALEPAIEEAVRMQAEGLYVVGGPMFAANQERIADLIAQAGLPATWFQTEAVSRGGLMSYGANRADLHRRAATFVDKILKGAVPGELPIEQPTVFDFVINLKTAEALGLTVPRSVLDQVTEVIE